jgi:hypothetical protein
MRRERVHVARMGDMRGAYRDFMGIPEEKKTTWKT